MLASARGDAATVGALLSASADVHLQRKHGSMVKVQAGQCLSSARAPPQGTPGGSERLGTPKKRPTH
eukprot:scaffold35633_cov56-Phaeocystis_antarctica.AAC.4